MFIPVIYHVMNDPTTLASVGIAQGYPNNHPSLGAINLPTLFLCCFEYGKGLAHKRQYGTLDVIIYLTRCLV